jgi:exonuclease SbcC
LTDLTFDQFRRTALLAQGEFDAFLRADAKERAELLEKITGAEIYGVLSQRAFERAREAQQATTLVERRRAEIGLMSEDERAAIDADVAATEADARKSPKGAARWLMRAPVRRPFRRKQSLRRRCRRAGRIAGVWRDGAAARNALQRWRRSSRCAPRDEMRRAEETQKAAKGAADMAAGCRSSFAAQRRERAGFRGSRRLGSEMTRLRRFVKRRSTRIELAEEAKARSVAQDAASRAQAKRDERAETMERRADIEREKETALADLARLEPARALSGRWREIDDWLTKRTELSHAKRACDGALAAAFADIDPAMRRLRTLTRATRRTERL